MMMTAAEAFNLHAERESKISARMPEGTHFHSVRVIREDDGQRFTFATGWGTCTLDRDEMVEIEF